MPSHFSSIGFDVGSTDDLAALANKLAPQANPVKVPGVGAYLHWHGLAGEEVWLQLDAQGEGIGLNPHFAGEARMHVAVTRRRGGHTPLDGGVHAWADPPRSADPAGGESGAYPFVADLPDAAILRDAMLPLTATAQIAAFAHELEVWDSEQAWAARPERDEDRMALKAFIPSGLFDEQDEPRAEAFFSGIVVRAAEKRNALTGNPYRWALVETFGGQYDVVVDPSLAPPLRQGNVVRGVFWLSARLLDVPVARGRGFLGWLKRGR